MKFVLALAGLGISATAAPAENALRAAKSWQRMTMVDLRLVGPNQLPTARLWHDRFPSIPQSKGSPQFSPMNAMPATAANIVIRSPAVVVMLSILQMDGACDPRPAAKQVWRCPMRIVRFEPSGTTIREGKACFAGGMSGGDAPHAYASYDPATRAIRLGVLAGGEAVEGCSQTVPVKGE
jgi:hypothetical protein